MRIVAGRLRGRTIAGPTDESIRPTSDRLRETIFNILAHAYDDPVADAAVIDLFAGTGAMGFEALSRGARRTLFVDDASNARALLRANVDALGLGGETRIFRRDARKLGDAPPGEQFSVAFLDPPYGQHLGEQALMALRDGRWLTPDALVVVEESLESEVEIPSGYRLVETRGYGGTKILFVRVAG
ncbi:MAG: 16S rRNA (guanine(966)-N(2))-methyltransferase RsmD [Methylovirgula sp.]|uniref:16S rRNA (guanine(966)-N(2))-methyltransferase RsmD n=1 Tax=Methylovirgula sp. TaxID=1978224 RepID=UPI003075F91F